MNKKIKEALFIFSNVLFLITSAIILTLLIAPLIHQMDVQKYGLDAVSGLTVEQIKVNFASLVDYLWIFNRDPLQLENFVMSTTGRIHFAEVKVFVDFIQVVFLVTGIHFMVGVVERCKKKEVLYLKQTAVATFVVLGTFLVVGLVSFDRLFVWFHQVVFRNDYWIFDWRYDPVILILPEDFFMHGFFAIIAFVLFLASLLLFTYKRLITQKPE